MTDTEQLKRVCAEASKVAPGPWKYELYHRVWDANDEALCKPFGATFGKIDALGLHFATFDPPTVSELLTRIEVLEGERDEAGVYTEAHERLDDLARESVAAAEARALTAEAELSRVKAEGERMRGALLETRRLVSAAAMTGFTGEDECRALFVNQGRVSAALQPQQGAPEEGL